jgi:transposase
MILTYKIRHNTDFSTELKQAFKIAEFAVRNPKCRTSKDVKEFGLKSAISNQILKKYGNQKTIKRVHNVNLVVPNQAIKVDKDNRTIRVVPLKLVLNYQFPDFQKVNQIELDREFAYISCTVAEQPEMIPQQFIGVDRNTTGQSRKERYDKQLKEKLGIDPTGKSTEEKMAVLRKYREAEYEKLKDAVYKRRGWNQNGVPTIEKAKALGIDFPDVIELLKRNT